MEDNTSNDTGIITFIKKRTSGDDQGNHINTYFNGTEISTVFDTCSPISTLKHNVTTEPRIIEIEHREPNSQGYKVRIHPSGKQIQYPFDTITEDNDKEPEEEEYMEPASKKDTLPKKNKHRRNTGAVT